MKNKEMQVVLLRKKLLKKAKELPLPQTKFTDFKDFEIELLKEGEKKRENKIKKEISGKQDLPIAFQTENDNSFIQVPEELINQGLKVLPLQKAFIEFPEIIEKYLYENQVNDKVKCLHLAKTNSGFFLLIPKNFSSEKLLHILFEIEEDKTMNFPSLIIFLEENSSANILYEENGIMKTLKGFSLLTKVILSQNSRANIMHIQNLPADTFLFSYQDSIVDKDAELVWTTGWFGSKKIKSFLNIYLIGEGSRAQNTEIFFARKREHFDFTSNLFHKTRNTKGEIRVRGILKDRAKAVFTGMVKVEKQARKTDGFLEEKVLLLSKGARNDAIPSLEIETDDVRATHSASTSPVNEEQIFYLRTRGLSYEESKKMIAQGFLQEGLNKLNIPYFIEKIENLIEEKW